MTQKTMNKITLSREVAKAPKRQVSGRFTIAMHNLAYICVGLALILAVTQFWLYGLRYRRIFSSDVWASVTLTNGQSYIGHLEQYGPNTVVLFDAYYLQAVATDAATEETAIATDTTATNDSSTQTQPNLQLVSIADDLHKPYNYLIINRDQVLYWQQLSDQSPIVQTLANPTAD